MLKAEEIERLNDGNVDPEFVNDITIEFLTELRENIFLKFLKQKATTEDRRFIEYLLVETARGLYGDLEPWVFYHFYHSDQRLKMSWNLDYLHATMTTVTTRASGNIFGII